VSIAAVLSGRAEILAATRQGIDNALRRASLNPETKPETYRVAGAALLRLNEIERKIETVLSETREETWAICEQWTGAFDQKS
jgi:hypothetical protein